MRGLLALLMWFYLTTAGSSGLPGLKSSLETSTSDSILGDKRFDYVVVGAGTAGVVVATRLAQKNHTVGLVEAGGLYEVQSLAAIPLAAVIPVGSKVNTKTSIDWGFTVEGQPGTNDRAIHYARGKCVGGSPTRGCMNQWATAVGDDSYTFDRVLPYFKRSVQFTPPNKTTRFSNATADFDFRAYDHNAGLLHVSYSNYAMPFSSWMKLGMNAIGINDTQEFNLGALMGAQYCASTIRPSDEARSSSHSFLKEIPPGLTRYLYATAQRVLFDAQKRATGVLVKGILGEFTLYANKEVILSAGAFQSPQLLMLSGIGPAKSLRNYGINVLADRPGVGQNMWDHVYFGPSYRVQVSTGTRVATDLGYLLKEVLNAFMFQQGPLTSPLADFLAWEKIPTIMRAEFTQQVELELAQFHGDWPEAEYVSIASFVGNSSNPVLDQPRDGYNYATIVGVLVAPTSRGSVTIQSADIGRPPVITPNWLASEADQHVAVAIFKRIRQAFKTQAMAPVLIGDEYYPGNEIESDNEILQFIKDNMMTIWHAACTCKMGLANDPMAVVDSKARVFGVNGLRVVDASAFPLLPPGHPQSVVYMLAEKISDAILDGH
ncbi:hypothetical protein BDV25DRAFT_169304 [Aspergillus avenaceus]|uniref:Glucose-methanol-choline oxidoreductase N-terminal domain-containing protein n=1 Tax=Aspergillus avenaceus TaxID=36643 RepID=A0A5N6U988_ASPAV|nr:hypothetical protein BDV25DRAFT_169304 [Aspergillus avenaceus]